MTYKDKKLNKESKIQPKTKGSFCAKHKITYIFEK